MSLQFSRTIDHDEFIDLKLDIECELSGETHWTDPNNGRNPHSDIIKITCYNEDDDEIDLYYTTDGEEYDIYEEEQEEETNIEGIIEHLQETGRCSFPNGDVQKTLARLEEDGYMCRFNQSDDYIILESRIYETELINCTPHAINLVDNNGNVYTTIEPSGFLPRCEEKRELLKIEKVNKHVVNINKKFFGEVTGLPVEIENTYYIVSALVAQACKDERSDLLVPDDIVRNDKGQIIGCRSLAKL